MSSNSSQAPPSRTPGPFDGPQWPYQAPRSTYVGVAVLMGTVVACASVVNGLVIVVSIRYKKLRSPLNYILVNLAVADLLVTLCGSSISLSNNINGFFVFGRKMCELEGFMVSLTGKDTELMARVGLACRVLRNAAHPTWPWTPVGGILSFSGQPASSQHPATKGCVSGGCSQHLGCVGLVLIGARLNQGLEPWL